MKVVSVFLILTVMSLSECKSQKGNQGNMADPKASQHTAELLSKMKENSQTGIMIGHQDDLAYGIGWKAPNGQSDIFRMCSDYPAVFGWDLGHIETGATVNLDSVPFSDIAKYAVDMYSRGGINTFSWHCNNPLTGGSAWDVKTKGVVKSILPGGAKNIEFNQWLDKVAGFFANLKDANGEPIPVLFRPFHEHTGSWFWWGKDLCTPEEFRQLWSYTVTYLTVTKNLHNLIFVFSTAGDFNNVQEFAERYPGNDFADILGFDIYQNPQQSNADFSDKLTKRLKILTDFAKEKDKPATVAEIGYEQIPDSTWWTKTFYPAVQKSGILYALFWRNAANRPNHYFVPYPGQKSEPDFKKFYDLPGTLFLKDLRK